MIWTFTIVVHSTLSGLFLINYHQSDCLSVLGNHCLTSSMSSLMLLLYSWVVAVVAPLVVMAGTGVEDWDREL